MKLLKKISINPEKLIKNSELVNLKGGYFHVALVCKHDDTILGTLYVNNCYYPAPDTQCQAVWPEANNSKCIMW